MDSAYDFEIMEAVKGDSIMFNIDRLSLVESKTELEPKFTLHNLIRFESKLTSHPSIEETKKFIVERPAKPSRPWKPAKTGTAARYAGILAKEIPELSKVTSEQIDKAFEETRYKD